MTPLADLIGPVAEGVILLGIAPAVVLVTGMMAVARLVEWWTERALASDGSRGEGRPPGSDA